MTAEIADKTSYDEVPYPVNAFFQTHPANLEFIGALFGMTPLSAIKCRVLEIGCASGGNLLPMADQMPDSTFVGIDYAQIQIDSANKLKEAAGLTNIEFKRMNILDFGEDQGTFDYIIVHGIYSWVPDEVKAKILSICGSNLSDNGIAYISYNTYPGWKFKGMLRDMILKHVGHLEKPADRVAQARAFTQFLADAVKDEKTAYAKFLQAELKAMKSWKDNYLYHDTLETINDPCYFHQFVAKAETVGLQYLGDVSIKSMLSQHLPQPTREVLARVTTNLVELEQYIDFLTNRQFRSTLLCRRAVSLSRNLQPERLLPFHVGNAALKPAEGPIDLAENAAMTFATANNPIIAREPLAKAMLLTIVENTPQFLPIAELLDTAYERVNDNLAEDQLPSRRSDALSLLFTLHCNGIVQLSSARASCITAVSEKPTVARLTRAQAEGGISLTTRHHRNADFDLIARRMTMLLDGDHTRDQIVAKLVAAAQTPELVIKQNDDHVTEPEVLENIISGHVDKLLGVFARNGLLIA